MNIYAYSVVIYWYETNFRRRPNKFNVELVVEKARSTEYNCSQQLAMLNIHIHHKIEYCRYYSDSILQIKILNGFGSEPTEKFAAGQSLDFVGTWYCFRYFRFFMPLYAIKYREQTIQHERGRQKITGPTKIHKFVYIFSFDSIQLARVKRVCTSKINQCVKD